MNAVSREGHLAIYNPETGAYGEFFGAEVGPRTLRYGYGGFISDARDPKGHRRRRIHGGEPPRSDST
jgi:hypothetical protein